ncbi:hypothetical protein NI389_16945 [Pseudoalteromonas xiamenensis]|uniref:hypothetical protein n=1 Tax=Pseudoalteromonas xiamenensis TaxID=882626 RepID=UPI0027E4557C|nr:hypothetical protein [Pseudoalteromonas xiamenensis]WMN59827.1 hypothetical protein NI389_16945 [Pseudoalteromonas xiamenensis]
MKFEQLLTHFDMGISIEQLQKESLLDIAILFMGLDGAIDDKEKLVVKSFARNLNWHSVIPLDDYITDMQGKCILAIQSNEVESFIQHRLKHIVDAPMRELALKLANEVSKADGTIDDKERRALSLLEAEII